MKYRNAYVACSDKETRESFNVVFEFTDTQDLIDQINLYCDEYGLEDVDVEVECKELSQLEIQDLGDNWIRVRISDVDRLATYIKDEMEKITQDMVSDPHHLGRYRAYKEILDYIQNQIN